MKKWRGSAERNELGRPDTPDVVPVVPIVVVGIQATPIVVQVVTIGAIVRRSRPPVPVPRIVDATIVVVAAGNWGILSSFVRRLR